MKTPPNGLSQALSSIGSAKIRRMPHTPAARSCLLTTILLAAGVSGLGGCGNNTHRLPSNRHFILDIQRQAPVRNRHQGVLRIRVFRAAQPFATDQLVYRVGRELFEIDYQKQFVAPPEAMFTEETRQWLASAGLFADVVGAGSLAGITHTLEGYVAAMYGDYTDPAAARAVLEIQFVLLRETRGRNPVVFDKTYRAQVPVTGPRAEDLVAAMNQALAQILTDLETDFDRRWEQLFTDSAS